MPSNRRKLILSWTLGFVLLTAFIACKKTTPDTNLPATPAPKEDSSVAPFATPLPSARLMGLKVNGQSPDDIARQSGDPTLLEGSDLVKDFQLENNLYTQQVLKAILSTMDSGKPLKGQYLYFGVLPKKYASHCQQDAGPDTCWIEPTVFECSGAIQQKNWTEENYSKICQSIGRLKILNPRTLIAAFDGDNTTWYQDVGEAILRRGVESGKIVWGEGRADFFPLYPSSDKRKELKAKTTPWQYYQDLSDKLGATYAYQFNALAFRGLSLSEAFAIFNESLNQAYRPNANPEMVELLQYLHSQGVVTALVSASPNFTVYPLAENLQLGTTLETSAGLDVMLQDPSHPENKPLRLSRLVLQGKGNQGEKFHNYQDVLAQYGSWTIVDVDPWLNAASGKGLQLRAITRRYVSDYNRDPANSKNLLDLDDMRLLLIGGDNFGPQNDMTLLGSDRLSAAHESGNDQGLSEGAAFLEKAMGGTDLLYVQRFMLVGGKLYAKAGVVDRFMAYLDQIKLLHPDRVGMVIQQPALTDLKPEGNSGGFLKETPQVSESQPMAESLPTVSPNPETKPEASPLAAPTPSGPQRPFGPLPPENSMGPTGTDTAPSSAAPPPAPPKLEPLPPSVPSKSDAF